MRKSLNLSNQIEGEEIREREREKKGKKIRLGE